ncbi:hypothetical protein Y032_0172g342 [Ancylostoma ceylanicum]|uniref:Uncharacterized protein n=1 Tax=Ancylostoma ceylanicum TaxID=53326 RepID=A0A016SUE5_9BILA|nr:hypothetical protein Y032_0172g342 [Ancylostoma ceylanicum]
MDQFFFQIIDSEKKAFEQEMRMQQRDKYAMKHSVPVEDRRIIPQSEEPRPNRESKGADDENWCYHCASPIKHLSSDMRKTIQQFLKVRRTAYPSDAVTMECNNAVNFTSLRKQNCLHPYCETISIVDHNEGTAFVLRGCAENFGAIDSKTLEQREDNSCTKLHEHLDIQECICKTRKYCYAGQSRRRSASLPVSFIILPVAFISTIVSYL